MKPTEQTIKLRVYPANDFRDRAKEAELRVQDLSAVDRKNVPVPLVDAREWDILREVHTGTQIVSLGSIKEIEITRGEINQTIYRRFITKNPKHARLVKGVEIGPYQMNERLSQGEREWFNESAFLKEYDIRPVTRLRRIPTQRITGIDERLRIVATILEPPAYFADSTNSIAVADESPYCLEYFLGLLNSTFFQWRFRTTSTNNNVGTNELEALPFRRIDFDSRDDVAIYKRIVASVRQLLRVSGIARTEGSSDRRRHAALTEKMKLEIDRCVEELCGLAKFAEQPWKTWAPPPSRRTAGAAKYAGGPFSN